MSHECSHCKKIFRTKSILNRHLISHLSIKPYQCEICEKTFTQNSSLVRHQAVVHTKDKKYRCPHCKLKFSQKYNVNIHIKRVHSTKVQDGTKYPCPHCTCIFNKSNSLNRHIAQIHSSLTELNETNNDSFGTLIEQLKMLQRNCDNDLINMDLHTVPDKLLSDSFDDEVLDREINKTTRETLSNSDSRNEIFDNKFQDKGRCFSCPDCKKIFRKKFDLSRHLRIHNKVKPFSCTKCDKSFTLKCTLERHLKTHLEEEKLFQCEICCKRFASKIKLDKHVNVHNLQKSFKCVLCPKSFKMKSSLATHEKCHRLKNPREEEIRKCLVPPITITDEIFPENVEYKYNCSKCSTKFKSLTHLKYHEAKHIGVKNFKCNLCERCFLSKSSLTCHNLVHRSIRAYKCQICSAKFKSSSNLKTHLMVHNRKRSFMCAYCCKHFKRKLNCRLHLDTHIKDVLVESEPKISNDKPSIVLENVLILPARITEVSETIAGDTHDILLHECNVCKKNFKKSNDLERHRRIHSKEKPFSCDKCNKSFTLKGTLQSHMKIHDENRTKIGCTVCGKWYATESALKLHLRIHTGELPFECDYCPKLFRTAGHKIAHTKQHIVKNKFLLKKYFDFHK